MPFSDSFSQSFRHEPVNIGELKAWLDASLGEWTIGDLTEEFLALFPFTIGDL